MVKPFSIWWHLWFEYHSEPYAGHANTSKARECMECQKIHGLLMKAMSDPA